MEFEKRKKINIHFNITPLIDIIFQLLVFFMLTTSFVTQTGIKVQLPDVKHKYKSINKNNIEIVIKNDKIYFNKKKINLNKLEKIVKKIQFKKVILKVDKNTKFEIPIKVMDILKANNVNDFILMTDLKENARR